MPRAFPPRCWPQSELRDRHQLACACARAGQQAAKRRRGRSQGDRHRDAAVAARSTCCAGTRGDGRTTGKGKPQPCRAREGMTRPEPSRILHLGAAPGDRVEWRNRARHGQRIAALPRAREEASSLSLCVRSAAPSPARGGGRSKVYSCPARSTSRSRARGEGREGRKDSLAEPAQPPFPVRGEGRADIAARLPVRRALTRSRGRKVSPQSAAVCAGRSSPRAGKDVHAARGLGDGFAPVSPRAERKAGRAGVGHSGYAPIPARREVRFHMK